MGAVQEFLRKKATGGMPPDAVGDVRRKNIMQKAVLF